MAEPESPSRFAEPYLAADRQQRAVLEQALTDAARTRAVAADATRSGNQTWQRIAAGLGNLWQHLVGARPRSRSLWGLSLALPVKLSRIDPLLDQARRRQRLAGRLQRRLRALPRRSRMALEIRAGNTWLWLRLHRRTLAVLGFLAAAALFFLYLRHSESRLTRGMIDLWHRLLDGW